MDKRSCVSEKDVLQYLGIALSANEIVNNSFYYDFDVYDSFESS